MQIHIEMLKSFPILYVCISFLSWWLFHSFSFPNQQVAFRNLSVQVSQKMSRIALFIKITRPIMKNLVVSPTRLIMKNDRNNLERQENKNPKTTCPWANWRHAPECRISNASEYLSAVTYLQQNMYAHQSLLSQLLDNERKQHWKHNHYQFHNFQSENK